MRDSQAYQMHEANARRIGLLLRQFEFIQTRQEAFERVINVSGFLDRLRWMMWPSDFWKVVDAVQINLLNDRKRKMAEAAAKPKIEVVQGANGIH